MVTDDIGDTHNGSLRRDRKRMRRTGESQLLQGEYYTNRKSSNLQSEVSFMPYSNTPLLDSVESSIANPTNFVESNDSGMLRNAVGTRDINRDVSK